MLHLLLELGFPAWEEQTQNHLSASHTHPWCPTGLPETFEMFHEPGEWCWHWGKPRAAHGMSTPWKAWPGCLLGLVGTWGWMKEGPSTAVLSPHKVQRPRQQSPEPCSVPRAVTRAGTQHPGGIHLQPAPSTAPVGTADVTLVSVHAELATGCLLVPHWAPRVPCWPPRMPPWPLLCLCPTRRKPWDHTNHTLYQGQITLCLSLTPGLG